MDAFVTMGFALLGYGPERGSRDSKDLGLAGMDAQAMLEYVESGEPVLTVKEHQIACPAMLGASPTGPSDVRPPRASEGPVAQAYTPFAEVVGRRQWAGKVASSRRFSRVR